MSILEKYTTLSPSAIFLAAVSVLFVVLTAKSFYDKRHIFKFAKKYKGYRFYPFIGNGYHLIGKNVFTGVQQIIKDHGLPCNMWIGHDYNYVTADPLEVKAILTNPNSFDKMRIYDHFKMAFENSLLLAPKSIIGIDYNLQVQPKVKLVEWIGEMQSIVGKQLLTWYPYPSILWLLFSEGRRLFRLLINVRKLIFRVIKQKRKAFMEFPVCIDKDSPGLPLLDAMLQAEGEKFTDRQIYEEMFLFTTAATDTSGYTLAYVFTLLGMHPEVQDNVYKEVMSHVGPDRPIYFDDLPNLKYTERAILESMRMLPVTPFLGRLATADIDMGTKVIPKGTNIFISVYDVHRNDQYWPEPLKFDPDRFLPEEVAKREVYSYIPFSGGSRNCIGKPYAMMLMKTCVANVVRNYEISSKYKSVSELKLTSCITMKTVDHLDCRFRPRVHENYE